MPKINPREATDTEYWMWPQSYEDATANLNWTGESQEDLEKKDQILKKSE